MTRIAQQFLLPGGKWTVGQHQVYNLLTRVILLQLTKDMCLPDQSQLKPLIMTLALTSLSPVGRYQVIALHSNKNTK